jgi:hypothetical protein
VKRGMKSREKEQRGRVVIYSCVEPSSGFERGVRIDRTVF